MKEIELKVLDMSSVLKPSDSFALVLEEVGGRERKLALIIGAMEAQGIRMAKMHYKPPRPFTHELMLSIMKAGRLRLEKGVIYEVKDGIYYTYLYVRRSDGESEIVDARTSDAIVLSLRAGFPLYVYEDLLEREQLRNISPDGSKYTVTMNSVDMGMLKRAMEEAVACEDYERASLLRDEIRRREHEGNNGD